MAIDFNASRTGLDRNKYYKKKYVNNMKLTQDAVVQGVFYSSDLEPRSRKKIVDGALSYVETIARITTNDYIADLEPDDFVLFGGDDMLYRVDEILDADIVDEAKPYNKHSLKYNITLKR